MKKSKYSYHLMAGYALVIVLSFLSLHTNAAESVFPVTKASYDAEIKGIQLSATRSITPTTHNQWKITQHASASFAELKETSAFQLTPQQSIQTLNHNYDLSVFGVGRKYSVNFSSAKHQAVVNDSKKGELEFSSEQALYSDLSYQLAMRLALIHQPDIKKFEFAIVKNKNKLTHYTFLRGEEKIIKTPIGKVQAVKFVYSKNADETIEFWLAVDYGYVLLSISTHENKKKVYELQLNELIFNGLKILPADKKAK